MKIKSGLAVSIGAILIGQAAIAADVKSAPAGTVSIGHVVVEKSLFSSKGQTDKKVAVCGACHGKNGAGDADFGPSAAFGTPALRGLTVEYMTTQLDAYRTGTRSHKEMGPMTALLSREDATEISQWYAKLPVPALLPKAESKKFSPKLIADGEAISLKGVKGDAATACVTCHQPRGVGLAAAFPRLAGQNAVYTANQLEAWKSGSRKNPSGQIMTTIAAKLGPDDIKAVAAYYESQTAR